MRPAGESDSEGEGDIEEYRGGVWYSLGARASPPDLGVDLEADAGLEDAGETEDRPGQEDGHQDLLGRVGASERQLR